MLSIRFSCRSMKPIPLPPKILLLFTSINKLSTASINSNIYNCNVKIGALSRAGKIKDARQLFDEMPSRDVVTWNAIITGYWRNGNIEESKKLFEKMPEKNVVSWNSMIAGCIENEIIDEGLNYFRSMPERNTASWNVMISGLVRYDQLENACKLFDTMPQRNVVSYTAMINGYIKKGEIEQARRLFNKIPRKNTISWTVMISGYVDAGKFEEARELYDKMSEKNVIAMTVMITGFCKEGKMDQARTLFEQIPSRDRVCWNAMITGYAQNGIGEETLKLHSEMLREGMKPDQSSLLSAFTACSTLASLKEGIQTHLLVIKHGFESNLSVCNSLVTTYSKCGAIHDSELAFEQISNPDLVSWNTIITAFAQHGLYGKAIDFFNKMRVNGFVPDGITFLTLLSSCARAGKVNESMDLLKSMVNEYKISPRSEHYACVVDILSRSGQLEKAYQMILEMPEGEEDYGTWGSLLAGCNVYLNEELGEIAAKQMMGRDPLNSGAYVGLSNIYAKAGKWRDVMRVRSWMKEQGVKKQNGYSWIEIGNLVHLFVGGDIGHLDIEMIHLELRRVYLHMMDENDDVIDSLVPLPGF